MFDKLFSTALDEPKKLERYFLWLLQSLLTIGALEIIFDWLLHSDKKCYNLCCTITSGNIFSPNVLETISPFHLATYLVIFALTWIIFWELLSNWLSMLIVKLIDVVFGISTRIVLTPIAFMLWIIRFALAFLRKEDKPRKFWKKEGESENETVFYRRLKRLRKKFEVFDYIENSIGTPTPYGLFLLIADHEKTDIIRTRVFRYYLILVVLFALNATAFYKSNISGIVLVLLVLSGMFIYILNYIYELVTDDDFRYVRPKWEFKLYKEMIYESFCKSDISGYYIATNGRKYIKVNLKPDLDEDLEYFAQEIEIVPIHSDYIDEFNLIAKNDENDDPWNHPLVIFVSESTPDLAALNFIESNKWCFVQVVDEHDFDIGLDRLKKIIENQRKNHES